MSKGDAEHAAQHQHGVQLRKEPPAPLTLEQRVAKLEARVADLEANAAAPAVKVAAKKRAVERVEEPAS